MIWYVSCLVKSRENQERRTEVKRNDKIGRFWIASALKYAAQSYFLYPAGDTATDTAYRLPGFEEVLRSVYYLGQQRFDRGARATFRLSLDLDTRSFRPRREEDGTTNTAH